MKIRELRGASVAGEVSALRLPESVNREVAAAVTGLVDDVRERGDAAVVEATARFDWESANLSTLVVAAGELEAAYRDVDPRVIDALETARRELHLLPQARAEAGLGG